MARDGMNYAPSGNPEPVVRPGEFVFAAMALDHGHIYRQTNGLLEAGGTLKWVYDPDQSKVAAFKQRYPEVRIASSEDDILQDPEVMMVAAAGNRQKVYGILQRTAACRKRSIRR